MSQRQQVRLLCFLAGVLSIALAVRWWSLTALAGGAAEWVGAPLATVQAAGALPSVADEVAEATPATQGVGAADEAPGDVEEEAGTIGTAGCAPLLNLNTATSADLETLPGVGPVIASAIVAERAARGGFVAVEDLLAVKGIGAARLARIAPLVCVAGSEKP